MERMVVGREVYPCDSLMQAHAGIISLFSLEIHNTQNLLQQLWLVLTKFRHVYVDFIVVIEMYTSQIINIV